MLGLWQLFMIGIVILWCVALVLLINLKVSSVNKLLWALIVTFVPLFGSIVSRMEKTLSEASLRVGANKTIKFRHGAASDWARKSVPVFFHKATWHCFYMPGAFATGVFVSASRSLWLQAARPMRPSSKAIRWRKLDAEEPETLGMQGPAQRSI